MLSNTYREYLNLIDLTVLPDDDSDESELDELPPVPVDLFANETM